MKKIIFNGCSFMAGDEIAWEQYCKEVGNRLTWQQFCSSDQVKTDADIAYWDNYQFIYKRNYNLPQFVINSLGLSVDDKIDISSDGKSNDMISISTINYILNLPPEERKNYHVVIGWTSIYRVMKYTSKYRNFMNLHVHHLDAPTLGAEDFIDYIKTVLVNSENEDLAINYFKNVMLLENFLIANNITYTFFRSLGSADECVMRNHHFEPNYDIGSLQLNKISNANNWVRIIPTDINPVIGTSWTNGILGLMGSIPENYVSKDNGHPSMVAAKNFAAMLSSKILEQQCLD
jgi:hypothetical protein